MNVTAIFVVVALIGSFCNATMRIKLSYLFWFISNIYLSLHNFYIEEYSQAFMFSAYLLMSIIGLKNCFKHGGWLDKYSANKAR